MPLLGLGASRTYRDKAGSRWANLDQVLLLHTSLQPELAVILELTGGPCLDHRPLLVVLPSNVLPVHGVRAPLAATTEVLDRCKWMATRSQWSSVVAERIARDPLCASPFDHIWKAKAALDILWDESPKKESRRASAGAKPPFCSKSQILARREYRVLNTLCENLGRASADPTAVWPFPNDMATALLGDVTQGLCQETRSKFSVQKWQEIIRTAMQERKVLLEKEEKFTITCKYGSVPVCPPYQDEHTR